MLYLDQQGGDVVLPACLERLLHQPPRHREKRVVLDDGKQVDASSPSRVVEGARSDGLFSFPQRRQEGRRAPTRQGRREVSGERREKRLRDGRGGEQGGAAAAGLALEVSTPTRRRLMKAALAPRPLETGTASSMIPDTKVSSTAPTGWVRGGGMGPLN